VAALLADRDEEADRLAVVDAVVVDPVLEAPLTIRQLLQRRARHALGVVDRLAHQLAHLGRPVPRDEVGELPLGDVAGGELRAQVAEDLHRHAHVAVDEGHDGLVELPRLVELHRRDAQPLGVDLGRVRRVGPRDAPADIRVVADGAGEGEALALVEERLEDEDVGQVHAAVERVVHHEHVALGDVAGEVPHDRFHRRRHRAQVARQRQPLRHQLALGVGEARGEVHVVLEHARVGRAHDGERHLVRDREDRVLEQLEGDRVDLPGHGAAPPMEPDVAREGRAPTSAA